MPNALDCRDIVEPWKFISTYISIVIIFVLMDMNLGFLCGDVSRLMRKHFDIAAREMGVTGPQWRVLANVARDPGLNQGTLADRLDVEPITTCRMVDRLEQAGLLERRRDPLDRRAWQLFLTDAAKPLMENLHRVGDEMLAMATEGLTAAERQILSDLMMRIRENLINQPIEPEPAAPDILKQDVASHG